MPDSFALRSNRHPGERWDDGTASNKCKQAWRKYAARVWGRCGSHPSRFLTHMDAFGKRHDPAAIARHCRAAAMFYQGGVTPHDFIRKWRNVELKERSASQSHFNDQCAWLGVADACGWGSEWRAGMGDDDILARLFALNQARAA